jgi:hypothetical protein
VPHRIVDARDLIVLHRDRARLRPPEVRARCRP